MNNFSRSFACFPVVSSESMSGLIMAIRLMTLTDQLFMLNNFILC